MPKNYQDMRTGIINTQGIRNIQINDDNVWGANRGQHTISIQYKGMSNHIYYYQDKALRDKIFQEIREKLLETK